MYAQVLTLAVTAAVAAGGAWQYTSAIYQRQISDLKTEYLKRDFKALEAANAETQKLQTAINTAARENAARQAALSRSLLSSRTALLSLSDAADSALRAANDSHATCLSNVAAFSDVFGECRSRLQEVAGKADTWVNQALTLQRGCNVKLQD